MSKTKDRYEKEIAAWQAKYQDVSEHGKLVEKAIDDYLESEKPRANEPERRGAQDGELEVLREKTGYYGVADLYGKVSTMDEAQQGFEGADNETRITSLFGSDANLTPGEMREKLLEDLQLMNPQNRTILFEFIFGEWKSRRGFFNHIQKELEKRGTPMRLSTISDRIRKGDFQGIERKTVTGGTALLEWRAVRAMTYPERLTYKGITDYRRALAFARAIDTDRERRAQEKASILNLPYGNDKLPQMATREFVANVVRDYAVYRLLLPRLTFIEKDTGNWLVPEGGYTREHFAKYHETYTKTEDDMAVMTMLFDDCGLQ